MESIQAITLSVIIAISGWFNDGLKNLEAGKFDQAIESLTKVYEKDVPGNSFRALSLFFRAQAYFGKDDKEKACADILLLLRMQPAKEIADEGRALYLKWGGAPEKLLPSASPKAVWLKFLEVAGKGDIKEALEMTSGSFRDLIKDEVGDDQDVLKELPERFLFVPDRETIGEQEELGKAELFFKLPDADAEDADDNWKMGFVHDVKNNVWMIDSVDENMKNWEDDGSSLLKSNLGRLKLIGQALKIYSAEFDDLFPASLELLREGGYMEVEDAVLWINPEDGSTAPFMYCPGLKQTDDVQKIIVAAPAAVDGWREVLFVDEHAEKMDEDKFKEAAAKQGWKFKGLVKKEEIPEVNQEQIRELVRKLADSDSNTRAEARKKLLGMGGDAFPVLAECSNDPDPEIRLQVKALLKGK